MATAIEFNNISKQYRLGLVSSRTLGADFSRWWTMNVRHQEDPYLKIGSVNDRSSAADSEFVWALRDIDFKVEQGDVVGIIGKNGAGKSTLLKLLSKVTAPTTGTICAKGRIGALLEVGTGFHPEMTGRENIYLNGAIMGMSKQEISGKLDEIVDFSGCERYIDTPVKRYSSGMTVRLGFAVAAHLDPEILVVDEVLAVGDAEFQKKAIGKMHDVSRGEGRTVLFVSHNMSSVRALCNHGIVLKNGTIDYTGTIDSSVSHYLKGNIVTSNTEIISGANYYSSEIHVDSITINGKSNGIVTLDYPNRSFQIDIEGSLCNSIPISIECLLFDSNDLLLAKFAPAVASENLNFVKAGHFVLSEKVTLPDNITNGEYVLQIDVAHPKVQYLVRFEHSVSLIVKGLVSPMGNELNYSNNGFLIFK